MPALASVSGMATKTVAYMQSNLWSRRTPVAYVGGWLGKQNLGDEALFQAMRALFPEFAFWHFDGSRTLATLMATVPKTSVGLFAGGTLINRAPEYLDIARRFIRADRSLHFFGSGVADPAFWNGRDDFRDLLGAWKPVLEQCGSVGVRGPRSAQLLAEAGVANVQVVGDPALAFAGTGAPHAVREGTLGMNIGFDHGHQWGEPTRLRQEMLALARLASAAGWRVKWFVVFPRDLAITESIVAELGGDHEIFCTYDKTSRYLHEVGQMSLFVGMKLHATMLALCAHVPSLMLEYEPKCADFMHSIGQGDALVRTDRFEAGAAWELLRSWAPERAARSVEISRTLQNVRSRQIAYAHQLSYRISSRRRTASAAD